MPAETNSLIYSKMLNTALVERRAEVGKGTHRARPYGLSPEGGEKLNGEFNHYDDECWKLNGNRTV